jgi:hypothetical protein
MKLRFNLTILFAFLIAGIFLGCTDSKEILKTTNALYLDIKTVVTDPAIQPGISTETLDKLVVIEQNYLMAALKLQEMGDGNKEPLSIIIGCGDEILGIIDTLVLDGKYERQISAIRLSIKILKNHLQLE